MNNLPDSEGLPRSDNSLPGWLESTVDLLDADQRVRKIEDAEVGDGMREVFVRKVEGL